MSVWRCLKAFGTPPVRQLSGPGSGQQQFCADHLRLRAACPAEEIDLSQTKISVVLTEEPAGPQQVVQALLGSGKKASSSGATRPTRPGRPTATKSL
jgi:hypothetical protein